MSEPTTTSHKAAALTAASALAMWEAAESGHDQRRAGAAMAEVLRAQLAKVRKPKAAADPRTLSAETLGVLLRRMKEVIQPRPQSPVLAMVLLQSVAGRLTVSGTDLDQLYQETLEAPGLTEFSACVPVRELAVALRGAKGSVGLEVLDGHLKVTVEGAASFLTAETTEFPIMEFKPLAEAVEVPVARLLETLEFVSVSVSTEETRYYLNGAYIHAQRPNNGAPADQVFVSTDGSRLMLNRWRGFCPIPPDSEGRGVILPRATLAWMLKNLKGETVKIDREELKIRLTTDTGSYITRLIDGSFPDYTRVIPRADDAKSVLGLGDVPGFVAALRKAASAKGDRVAAVVISAAGDQASIKVYDGKNLKTRIDIPAAHLEGEAFEASFNATLLAENLEAGGDETATLSLDGPNNPALILWPSQPERLGILMPLRTQ